MILEHEEKILITTNKGAAIVTEMPKHATIPYKDYLTNTHIAYWGIDNQLPFEIKDDIKKTPTLSQALYWISKAWISGGLVYGSLSIDEATGKDVLKRKNDKRVNDFLRKSQINTEYLPLASNHLLKYWMTFSEIVRSEDRSQILSIKAHKSPWCRLELQDNKTGRINNCFINAQWDLFEGPWSEHTVKIPIVQKGYDPVGQLRQREGKRFIYTVQGVGDHETYYPTSPWHSIRESQWLKLVQEVPIFKTALMKNQTTIKYHIKIHPKYWENKYPDWANLGPEERKNKKSEAYKEIDNCLAGTTNAGKSIWSGYLFDPASNKEIDFVRIEVIEDKIQDGKYLEDSQEGVATILYSLGFDGTLIGSTPSKSLGAGSGSDKREAWNIFITNCKPEQDKIIEPIDFACQYNGFVDENGEPYTFWFKNYYLQTLDQVSTSNRQTTKE